MPRKRPEGAPPLRPRRANGTATSGLLLRFSEEERQRVKQAGEVSGPTVSEWARQVLLREAEAVLGGKHG